MNITLQALMKESGVAFGTSGARGLATAMTDRVCHTYTLGFLQYLARIGDLTGKPTSVAVAGDFRPSTDRIMAAVCRAIRDAGHEPVNCGKIPSPAVALRGLDHRAPAIMVTGSHIPDDRNGIKFNKPAGEILKSDEAALREETVTSPDALFGTDGAFREPLRLPPVEEAAGRAYVQRYLDFFPADCLRGFRVGVYQHSSVAREVIAEVFRGLGAEVTELGRADRFIPVDTEAIRPEDVALAREWGAAGQFDALVSADGDGDRPLISDAQGEWLRGDVAGVLAARFLKADSVSTPVSCNTAVERCGWFEEVRRTRIGSPYVVASMIAATAAGARRVVGYEANGGFLLNSDVARDGRVLRALPTRDALIVLLSLPLLARARGGTLGDLLAALPPRFTASDRLKNFATERSRALLERFQTGDESRDTAAVAAVFGSEYGPVAGLDRTDGLRITFASGDIVHLRPSGNAPEFRCYAEASTPEQATALTERTLALIARL